MSESEHDGNEEPEVRYRVNIDYGPPKPLWVEQFGRFVAYEPPRVNYWVLFRHTVFLVFGR